MEKTMPILLLFLCTLSYSYTIWSGNGDTEWYKDSAKAFAITTPEQLAGLAKLVNSGQNFYGKTVRLESNIILNDTTNWQNWASNPPKNKWVPIGIPSSGNTSDIPFNGTFDGNGYAISGIYTDSTKTSQSLFGLLGSNGTIKNLGVTASYIIGKFMVSGLVGWSYGSISDSYSTALVESVGSHAGGLVGWSRDGIITDSYFSGKVTGNGVIGGLVGINSSMIINSYSSGTVIGRIKYSYEKVGGLVGYNDGSITNSHFTGNVIGKSSVGGLVGLNYTQGAITNSYSIGNVTGERYVGGLVGCSDEGIISGSYFSGNVAGKMDSGSIGGLVGANYSKILNSYSSGKVTGTKMVGGLVGSNYKHKVRDHAFGIFTLKTFTGTIINSYSTSNVFGDSITGGLIGKNDGGKIIDSYYDKETSGQKKIMDGKGKTSAEMKRMATFKGWDFKNIWGIDDVTNDGYPYLRDTHAK